VLALAACQARKATSTLYAEAESFRRHGFVQRALEVTDRGSRQAREEGVDDWLWRFRLLRAELLLSQDLPGEAGALLVEGGAAPSSELGARYLADLGQARRDRAMVEEAFAIATRNAYSSLLPSIQLKRANLDGYTRRSESFLKDALASARSQSDSYLEAAALLDLGFQRLNMMRFDEAIAWLEPAQSVARRIGADRIRGRALGSLGWCYYRLGELQQALRTLSEAVTLARRVGDDHQLRWLNNIGNIYYRQREFRQAISYYHDAAELARRQNDGSWLAMTLDNLAAASLESGDLAAGERFNSQAQTLVRENRDLRSQVHTQLHTAWIEVARKQPRAEFSFRTVIDAAGRQGEQLVRWEAQAGLAQFLRQQGRSAEADSEFRAALDTIEKEWSKLGDDRYKVTFLAQLIRFYGDYVDFLVGRGEIERAAVVADSARARVIAEKLADEPGAGQIDIRRRTVGTVLLSYWLAPERSYLWLIGASGVTHFVLPGEAAIARLSRQYSAAVERGLDPLGDDNPFGRALFEAVLAPARSQIPKNSAVIVVPDGVLHGLNFETLIVAGPEPHYWIEDVTLSVAPALGLLQSAPTSRPASASVLFLGDPKLNDSAFPPLPHLKEEADIIRRLFPGSSRLLTGEAADPPAYRASTPGDYRMIHFATHAVANADSPLNSAVILSPSAEGFKLYAKDVIAERLQAELVTVSACHSAGSKAYAGEGLLGFTWAFLQAGARNVVAGLWDADDAATAEIMTAFYKRLASGARPAEALRSAKLERLKSKGPHRLPYYWGTLQLFTRELANAAR